MSGGHWWEHYFVRYFVGSVFGALFVFCLLVHPDSGIRSIVGESINMDGFSLRDVSMPLLFMALCLGVAFCYISSAPILVLHSVRYAISYDGTGVVNKKRKMIFLVLLIVLGVALALVLKFSLELALYSICAYMLIFIQFCVLIFAFLIEGKNNFYGFYNKLSRRRASSINARKEYVESYRHLIEHGNAYLILITECCLGMALFPAKTISDCIIILLLWLFPSTITWVMASYLESRLGDVN